ncbi:diguanylate cyclase domain-containing protein [Desulfuromonas thiophila]|uniref:diguanylate cyclase domain-containing protein n=1 Tax=Desulfuromonas thiophila TaxID=57664 RepID=UPI0029F5A1C7|nr:diguanylate cyclase [Desulfuromonas thiophila]
MGGWWWRLLAGLVVLLGSGLLCPALVTAADETLTLGFFAYRPKELLQQRWQPLIDHLSAQLPGKRLELRLLDQAQMQQALTDGELDFVFTNPSHYIRLRAQTELTGAIATQVSLENALPTAVLAGVVVRQKARTDLRRLEDLRGQRVACAGKQYLGGYTAQAAALLERGVPLRSLKLIETGQPHDRVVRAVLQGEVDAGFIRTGLLESLVREGRQAEVEALEVIELQNHRHFPFVASTPLYPEWPWVALPHVDGETCRRLSSLLLGLEPDHPAVRAAGIHGFAVPADYSRVEAAMQALRLPPFDRSPAFTWADIWRRYWPGLLATVLVMLLLASLTLALHRSRSRIRRAHRELRQATDQLRLAASVFEHSYDGILITDAANRIVKANPAFSRITGYSLAECLGQSPAMFGSGRHDSAFFQDMWQRLASEGFWQGEIWNRRKNGEVYPQKVAMSLIRDEAGQAQYHMAVFSDISLEKKHEAELDRLAHYDVLTGIPNRRLLTDRLAQAMAQARRSGQPLAVCMLDLDGFKLVNDRLGHEAGDQLLVEVARRLQQVIRAEDTVGRLGGDEFVLIFRDCQTPVVFERILAALRQPVALERGPAQVGASLGISYYRSGVGDGDQLLREADQALYQAKRTGRNRYCLWSSEENADLP